MARYLLMLLLLANTAAYAETAQTPDETNEESVPSPLTTELELGYQSLSGNSDSQSMNTRLKFIYTKQRFYNTAEFKFLLAEKDGEEDKRKGSIEVQSNMIIDDRTYVFGNANYIDDRYGPYYADFTFSSGLGYRLFRLQDFQMRAEAGPGYRHQEPNLDEIGSGDIIKRNLVDEPILRGYTIMTWKPSKTVEFSASLTGVAGNSNSTIESELNMTSSVTERIAIKISNTQKLYSWVPDGLEKRDSTTMINMLFKM
ncbi:TPA: DUF481 domain-containing protein [Photobacterium damselae]